MSKDQLICIITAYSFQCYVALIVFFGSKVIFKITLFKLSFAISNLHGTVKKFDILNDRQNFQNLVFS